MKLIFRNNQAVDSKLRWLSEVTRAFRLDRELTDVKVSAVTSRFVYISRRCDDIIESATIGEFLSLKLDLQDSIERPRKFLTSLSVWIRLWLRSCQAYIRRVGLLSPGASIILHHQNSPSASFLAFHPTSLEG